MDLRIFVLNKELINAIELAEFIKVLKHDYYTKLLPSKTNLMFVAIRQEDEEDLEKELDIIAMSNPAYEFQSVSINNQTELDNLHLINDSSKDLFSSKMHQI